MKKNIIKGIFILGMTSGAHAAVISWGSSTLAFDSADESAWVSQNGTLVSSINATNTNVGATTTIGGIDWVNANAAATTAGVTQNGVTFSTNAVDDAGFGNSSFTDTNGFYNSGSFNLSSVSFTGLTIGQTYEIQILGSDARGTDVRNTIFGDGTQSAVDSVTAGTAGNVLLRTNPAGSAGFVTGTFIADGTTQDILITGNRSADLNASLSGSTSQFNALQLRAIPEPSSSFLLGLGGMALVLRRRK